MSGTGRTDTLIGSDPPDDARSPPTPPTARRSRHDPAALEPGTLVAAYRIQQALGAGGMGAVYLARHETLNRLVALKLFSPRHWSDEGVTRFLREARLAASIDHPNLVVVHDAGDHEGLLYIAYGYHPRGDLWNQLERLGPIDPWRGLSMLLDLAHALRALWEAGIVHRDIKPANILLAEDGRVMLGDLGLAASVVIDGGLTESGTVLGTPMYMSPEQVRGRSLDSRSDIFSLGATAYSLLTGRAPWSEGSTYAIMDQVAKAPTPDLRVVAPDAPAGLQGFIERCMAKQADQRFADPAEMIGFLQDLRTRVHAPSTPATAPEHGPSRADSGDARRRWSPGRRSLTLAIALGGALLVAGVGLGLTRRPDPPSTAIPSAPAAVESPPATGAAAPAADAAGFDLTIAARLGHPAQGIRDSWVIEPDTRGLASSLGQIASAEYRLDDGPWQPWPVRGDGTRGTAGQPLLGTLELPLSALLVDGTARHFHWRWHPVAGRPPGERQLEWPVDEVLSEVARHTLDRISDSGPRRARTVRRDGQLLVELLPAPFAVEVAPGLIGLWFRSSEEVAWTTRRWTAWMPGMEREHDRFRWLPADGSGRLEVVCLLRDGSEQTIELVYPRAEEVDAED